MRSLLAPSLTLTLALALAVIPRHVVDARPPVKRQALATVYESCVVPNTAALTFDDGPYIYNLQISQLLTSHGAKGTFFFNGNNYDCIYSSGAQTRIKQVYSAGHQVGSHTWSHADLTTLSSDQINDGMYRVEEALSRIIGIKPAFMRPPFGSYNNLVRQVSASRGQALALWDWDTGDADGNTTAQSEAVYQDAVNDGVSNMLVLNHETQSGTANTVIPYAINLLQSNGYKLVTMAECLGIAPYSQIGTPQTQTSAWACDGTPDPGAACGGSIPCKTGQINVNNPGGGGGGGGGTPNTPQSNIWIHPLGSSAPNKCLTSASNANNAAVTISDCVSGNANQLWSVTTTGISIYGGARCLDVTSGSSANGNKMQVYACTSGNSNQLWSVAGSSGSGSIQWTGTGSCLDDTSGSTTNGNPVQIWSCTSGPNQQWTISAPSGGGGGGGGTTGSPIRTSKSSTTCLTVASNANNAPVTVTPCSSGAASQSWTLASNGQLQIYGNKCLDVPSGSTANGVKMQVYTCTSGNTNQVWTRTSASPNQIQWTTHPNECLDLTDGSTASGNQVQMWACVAGSSNQGWVFG